MCHHQQLSKIKRPGLAEEHGLPHPSKQTQAYLYVISTAPPTPPPNPSTDRGAGHHI